MQSRPHPPSDLPPDIRHESAAGRNGKRRRKVPAGEFLITAFLAISTAHGGASAATAARIDPLEAARHVLCPDIDADHGIYHAESGNSLAPAAHDALRCIGPVRY